MKSGKVFLRKPFLSISLQSFSIFGEMYNDEFICIKDLCQGLATRIIYVVSHINILEAECMLDFD